MIKMLTEKLSKQQKIKNNQLLLMAPLYACIRQITLKVIAKATTTGFSVFPCFMLLEVNHTVHH